MWHARDVQPSNASLHSWHAARVRVRLPAALLLHLPLLPTARVIGRSHPASRTGAGLGTLLNPSLVLRPPPQNGLAPRVVELLRRPNATAALSLLQMLRAMYEHHPRPKVGPAAWCRGAEGCRILFWQVLACASAAACLPAQRCMHLSSRTPAVPPNPAACAAQLRPACSWCILLTQCTLTSRRSLL